MPETLVDRFTHPSGLAIELLRREDTPEGCLVYRRSLWGDVTLEETITKSQANGVAAWCLEEGFQREER